MKYKITKINNYSSYSVDEKGEKRAIYFRQATCCGMNMGAQVSVIRQQRISVAMAAQRQETVRSEERERNAIREIEIVTLTTFDCRRLGGYRGERSRYLDAEIYRA